MRELDEVILSDIQFRGLWIYGSGSIATTLAHELERHFQLSVEFLEFTEREASGQAPFSLVDQNDLTDAIVLMGVHNEFGDSLSITERLAGLGARVISLPSLMRWLGESGVEFSNYMLVSDPAKRSYFLEVTLPIRELFADERSRIVFDAFRNYVGNLIHDDVGIDAFSENSSWPSPNTGKVGTFVEAGASDGQHLETFKYLPSTYIGFEPLFPAYQKLSERVRALNVQGLVLPIALGDTLGLVPFEASGTASSLGSEGSAKESALVVRLDDVLGHFSVDVLRMDVEGAELAVLTGAEQTIRNFHPILQIAVYHRPFDLVEVAQKVRSLGYRELFIRTHRHNFFDTFLYCC